MSGYSEYVVARGGVCSHISVSLSGTRKRGVIDMSNIYKELQNETLQKDFCQHYDDH